MKFASCWDLWIVHLKLNLNSKVDLNLKLENKKTENRKKKKENHSSLSGHLSWARPSLTSSSPVRLAQLHAAEHRVRLYYCRVGPMYQIHLLPPQAWNELVTQLDAESSTESLLANLVPSGYPASSLRSLANRAPSYQSKSEGERRVAAMVESRVQRRRAISDWPRGSERSHGGVWGLTRRV